MRYAQRLAGMLGLVATFNLAPAHAQVAEIEVTPAQVTVTVGGQQTVSATAFDARGVPVSNVSQLTWVSTRLGVARVDWDPNDPSFATIIGVAPGQAQIEARIGNVRSGSVFVIVEAVTEPQARPEPEPDDPSVLPADAAATARDLVARIEPHNFGFAQGCRVGGWIAPNLLATSYTAIRGADSVEVIMGDGTRIRSGVRVAAYDASLGLAVLHVPTQRSGAFNLGSDPDANDAGWVVGQPGCQGTTVRDVRVSSIAPGSGGRITLNQTNDAGQLGAPIIDNTGALVGVAGPGSNGMRVSDLAELDRQARRNVGAGALRSLGDVAAEARHAYGSIALTSTVPLSVARITPLETWHWPELAQQTNLPLNFAGPEGRYRVELLSAGQVQSTTTITIQPGVAGQQSLGAAAVATTRPEPEQGGGGGGAGILIPILLLGGGGVAAAVLLAGGGDEGPPPPPTRTTGDVRVTVIIP